MKSIIVFCAALAVVCALQSDFPSTNATVAMYAPIPQDSELSTPIATKNQSTSQQTGSNCGVAACAPPNANPESSNCENLQRTQDKLHYYEDWKRRDQTVRYLDYYWRDYDGTIPEDAFRAISVEDPCGVEQNVSYIGQVYVHGVGLLVGGLTPGSLQIITTGGIEQKGVLYNRTKNIKILSTRSPQNLQWFSTNRTHIQSHRNLNFVIGGAQATPEGVLYIGRVNYQGWRIGKIDGYWSSFIDIYFPYNGTELSPATGTIPDIQYEVLIYNEPSVASRGVDLKLALTPGH